MKEYLFLKPFSKRREGEKISLSLCSLDVDSKIVIAMTVNVDCISVSTKMEDESRHSLEATGVHGEGRNPATKELTKRKTKITILKDHRHIHQ